jgi:hypothetical protein
MECEEFGYPNYTTTGERMYENTHFMTEQEAWTHIMVSVEAGVCLAGSHIRHVETQLRKAREEAGDAARDYDDAHRKYKEWQRSNNDNLE